MDFLSVTIRCRCGEQVTGWCVRIGRRVPPGLRCQPTFGPPGGGPRAILCPRGHRCFDGPEDLERAVDRLISRGGWGKWQREGVVVVEC